MTKTAQIEAALIAVLDASNTYGAALDDFTACRSIASRAARDAAKNTYELAKLNHQRLVGQQVAA